MNIKCALGKRCGPLPRLMFDTLLSALLIRSNNSHLCKLPLLLREMIYEALNFKLQGHCQSCRWRDTARSLSFYSLALILMYPFTDILSLEPVFSYLLTFPLLFCHELCRCPFPSLLPALPLCLCFVNQHSGLHSSLSVLTLYKFPQGW